MAGPGESDVMAGPGESDVMAGPGESDVMAGPGLGGHSPWQQIYAVRKRFTVVW